jgi:ElaB/YqjD/DUF883 family membrane-anchored ribosome-binding protein
MRYIPGYLDQYTGEFAAVSNLAGRAGRTAGKRGWHRAMGYARGLGEGAKDTLDTAYLNTVEGIKSNSGRAKDWIVANPWQAGGIGAVGLGTVGGGGYYLANRKKRRRFFS